MKCPREYLGKHPGEIVFNKLIKNQGISFKELSKTLETSTGYLDDFLKGERNLWLRLAEKLEEHYGITIELMTHIQKVYNSTKTD